MLSGHARKFVGGQVHGHGNVDLLSVVLVSMSRCLRTPRSLRASTLVIESDWLHATVAEYFLAVFAVLAVRIPAISASDRQPSSAAG